MILHLTSTIEITSYRDLEEKMKTIHALCVTLLFAVVCFAAPVYADGAAFVKKVEDAAQLGDANAQSELGFLYFKACHGNKTPYNALPLTRRM